MLDFVRAEGSKTRKNGIWCRTRGGQALRQSSAALPETKITSLARTAHALSYGWYSHDLLFYFDDPQHSRSIEEIATAIVDLVRANTRA